LIKITEKEIFLKKHIQMSSSFSSSLKNILVVDFATNWKECFYSSSVNHLHKILTSIGYNVTVIGYDGTIPSSFSINSFNWIILASDMPDNVSQVKDIHDLPNWLHGTVPIYGLGYGGLILAKYLSAEIVQRNNLNTSKLVTEIREREQITGQRFFNQKFAITSVPSDVIVNGINENNEIVSFVCGNFTGVIYQPEYPKHFDSKIWESLLFQRIKSPSRLM